MIVAEKPEMEMVGGQLRLVLASGGRRASLGSGGVFHQQADCDFTAVRLINIAT